LDLSPFVTAEASLAFHTTTKHCKLHHTGALEEAALRGWERSNDGEVDASTQTIFIRGEDDIFTLSLDASGDHLYRRGVLIKRGEAPLRENLAAAMVRLIDHSVDFWDPFCGSGTLMLERWLQLTRYPLGAFRAFAFESWPCINTERREKVTAELLKASTPCVSKIQGSDADPAAVQMSQENLAVLPASHGSIDVKSFEIKAGMEIDPKDTPMAIMTNPPYNDRLEQNAEHLLALAKWARSKDAVTLYYLLPKASKKLGLKVVLSFQNGGKRVKVFSR
jgi:putative N6-adenine-specific DNA methylase